MYRGGTIKKKKTNFEIINKIFLLFCHVALLSKKKLLNYSSKGTLCLLFVISILCDNNSKVKSQFFQNLIWKVQVKIKYKIGACVGACGQFNKHDGVLISTNKMGQLMTLLYGVMLLQVICLSWHVLSVVFFAQTVCKILLTRVENNECFIFLPRKAFWETNAFQSLKKAYLSIICSLKVLPVVACMSLYTSHFVSSNGHCKHNKNGRSIQYPVNF